MANITITVQSLLNTAVFNSYTIDNAQTINQLKTAINSARGFDSSWYDIVQNGSVVAGTATLTSLGIVTGAALRTHNKIGRLATKQLKQTAKLNLAKLDRTASGESRVELDTTELPTVYSGNNIVDNANTGGLILGRPWVSTPPGDVTLYGFFENQLIGGTYMTFDETISGIRVQTIVTNFNGVPTNGSYIKINGTLIAGDRIGTAPDGTNTTSAPFQMTRGHTITILNPATFTSRSGFPKCYDTYGTPSLGTSIAADIQAAALNDIIVIGTFDATSCNANFRNALTAYCGATTYTNTWTSVRTSHMFLGRRNSTA
jgi:hypothetical protein